MRESALPAILAIAGKRLKGGGERLAKWAEACEPRVGEAREARSARLDAAYLSIFGELREKRERPAPQQQELGFGPNDDENDPVPF